MTQDPNQWLGLLKWSLQYQDGTRDTAARPLSDEDKEFLMGAMDSLVLDEAKRMKELMEELESLQNKCDQGNESEVLDEDIEVRFEELIDICGQIDCAVNLHKMGKFRVLVESFLRSRDARFRQWGAEVIAVCMQNNPPLQAAAMELGTLAYLTHLAAFDDSILVRTKAMLGVGSLVREFAAAEAAFLEMGDGLRVLVRGATTEGEGASGLRRKCVHLLSNLVEGKAGRGAALAVEEWQVEGLLGLLGSGDIDMNEAVVRLLGVLAASLGVIEDGTNEEKQWEQWTNVRGRIAAAVGGRLQQIGDLRDQEQRQDAEHEAAMLKEVLNALQQPIKREPRPQSQNQHHQTNATTTTPDNQQQNSERASDVFAATAEWQEVRPGQAIPTGLHVKLDMTTGQRWAKLNEDDKANDASKMAVVCVPPNSSVTKIVAAEEVSRVQE
eukprot:c15329_g1_i1.p1 GENE.c15329_g1_i1~~c15329_g1_i1.p1  ORF type:complete len:440 (+),score=140.41 c15329_g1_i1:141-1460(+)